MEIIKDIPTMRELRNHINDVGCVMTMGAIHEGHMSLIEQAVSENDYTVATIFVNPLQFSDESDLATYPRTLESDLQKMNESGVKAVFIPNAREMYSETLKTRISFPGLSDIFEGIDRPGHFDGVGMVVTKLLNIIMPDRSYFGTKDYQQLAIIKTLVNDLNVPTEIVSCPTIRTKDGLAVSSRNSLLSDGARDSAAKLYSALVEASSKREEGQELTEIVDGVIDRLEADPWVDKVHYFSFVSRTTLEIVTDNRQPCVLVVAATVGGIRLIDNLILD